MYFSLVKCKCELMNENLQSLHWNFLTFLVFFLTFLVSFKHGVDGCKIDDGVCRGVMDCKLSARQKIDIKGRF